MRTELLLLRSNKKQAFQLAADLARILLFAWIHERLHTTLYRLSRLGP